MTNKINDYYQNLYSNEEENYNANGHKFKHLYNGRVKLVKNMLLNIEKVEHKVLDAGCGNGLFFQDAIKNNLQMSKCDGIDLLEEAVNLSINKYDEIYCGSTVELSKYFKTKYTFISSMEIFTYISPKDRKKFFSEHIDLLEKDGYFLLTVTNLKSIYRKVIKPEPLLFPYYFDKKLILEEIKQFDVDLVAVKGVDIFNFIHDSSSLSDFFMYELSFLFKKKS